VRFRQVRTYTTWNEANHESQPVASHPEAVAGYCRSDAGLVRPDDSLRPSYAAMLRGIAGQPAAAASVPATVTGTLCWTAAWSRSKPSTLLVRVRCRTSGARCAGRVALTLRTRRRAEARRA
jgi:hypothetical protein